MAEAGTTGFFTPPTVPDPIAEQRNKKKSKLKYIFVLIFFLVVLGLGGAALMMYRDSDENDQARAQEADPAPVLLPSQEVPAGTLEAIEEQPFGNARFSSENFRIGDVAIGGEAEFLLTEDTIDPLALSGIRGDAFTEKNSSDVNLVVSWRTNKLAKSEIVYSKGLGQPERVVREANYGLTHSLIIPDLEPGTTYVYTVTASDRFGARVSSDQHAIYTGSREASLFDLIAGAVAEIFGWALK